MKQVFHNNPDSLQAGEFYLLSPQGLGALVRKKRIEKKPKLGHEIRLTRKGKSDCWVTKYLKFYEVRCYH